MNMLNTKPNVYIQRISIKSHCLIVYFPTSWLSTYIIILVSFPEYMYTHDGLLEYKKQFA